MATRWAMRLRATEPVRQCAWCLAIRDDSGQYTLMSSELAADATHGICPSCKADVRRSYLASIGTT